jgi:hypothetical protein
MRHEKERTKAKGNVEKEKISEEDAAGQRRCKGVVVGPRGIIGIAGKAIRVIHKFLGVQIRDKRVART